MSLTVSPAVKVFALVGVIAALALAGGMFVLGGRQEDAYADDVPLVLPKKKGGLLNVPATAKDVAAKADKAAPRPATVGPAKPAAKASKPEPSAKAKPAAKPRPAKPKPAKPKPAVAKNGLPWSIASALGKHQVVVVALFGDGARVDPLARAEAEAGAQSAHAGFVVLDVTKSQKEAEALTFKLGSVLRSPAVLVFTRPDVLKIQLDGFRDRDTVAQAALDALR